MWATLNFQNEYQRNKHRYAQRCFSNADLPYPVAKNIADNIAKEQFADSGIVTLGDYFNQTIVSLFINILVFLLLLH